MRSTILTAAAFVVATSGAAHADAGAELAARLAEELGIETRTMMGLTGPAALQGEALSDTRTLDVSQAHPALDGYLFRSRYIVVGPGGIVPLHSHADRIAITYTMNGEIIEMRSSNDEPQIRRTGDITFDADIAQWWYNETDEPVFIFVADVCPEGSEPACTLEPTEPATPIIYSPVEGQPSWPEEAGETTIDGYTGPANKVDETVETLGEIDLAAALSEREELGDLTGLTLRARRVTVGPGGVIPLHTQPDRPNYFVVTQGNLTSYGPNGTLTVGPSHTHEDFGATPTWWHNAGAVPVELIAVDVVQQ